MSIATAQHLDTADTVVLLAENGGQLLADELFSPYIADVDDAELCRIYEDLVVVRRIDAEATALQRQGELALWAPLLGQEAAQVGSARGIRPGDFVFGSYREHAVAYLRGVDPTLILRFWRGSTHSGWNPYDINMTTPAIVIGSQMLQAVGYAMGIMRDAKRDDSIHDIAVTYFGDGATSQGGFSEALGFAASATSISSRRCWSTRAVTNAVSGYPRARRSTRRSVEPSIPPVSSLARRDCTVFRESPSRWASSTPLSRASSARASRIRESVASRSGM